MAMSDGEQVKRMSYLWFALPVVIAVAGAILWLDTGRESCPPGAHPLMMFAAGHNLHYRLTLNRQLDQASPYWCTFLWPKGQHWYSEDSFTSAGLPYHPLWKSCGSDLSQSVSALLADYSHNPHGDYTYIPNKTLMECER